MSFIYSKAIIKLLLDDELREQLGMSGYEFVHEECNCISMAKNSLRLYEQVLQNNTKNKGNIYKGSELNKRTNSYKYNGYSTYVVIFWSNEQASVIELDYYYGSLGYIGVNGKDQQGYPWEIKEGHNYCW